jgi:hypothetical protein
VPVRRFLWTSLEDFRHRQGKHYTLRSVTAVVGFLDTLISITKSHEAPFPT